MKKRLKKKLEKRALVVNTANASEVKLQKEELTVKAKKGPAKAEQTSAESARKSAVAEKTARKQVKAVQNSAEAVQKPAEAPQKSANAAQKPAEGAEKAPAKAGVKKSQSVLNIQYGGVEISKSQLENEVKRIWKEEGRLIKDMKDVEIYVKPQEEKAYYVVNGEVNGTINCTALSQA